MWPQLVNLLVGLWLVAAPPSFEHASPGLTINDALVGLFIIAVALVSLWEVSRSVRWLNFGVGIWMTLAPLVLGCEHTGTILSDFLLGLLLVLLAARRGKVIHRYGGGWSALWQ